MKQKSDYIRLNLKSIQDLPDMLMGKAKEYLNIQITNLSLRLNFREVGCSHGAPIGRKVNWGGIHPNEPRRFLGWHGQICCKVDCSEILSRSEPWIGYASEYLFSKWSGKHCGFTGFHTGSGCPGCAFGSYNMNIEFYLFIDDFPLLQENYKKWEVLKTFENKQSKWNSENLRTGQFTNKDWI